MSGPSLNYHKHSLAIAVLIDILPSLHTTVSNFEVTGRNHGLPHQRLPAREPLSIRLG